MRRAWPVLGLFVALRVADADDYPVEYVDRPLLLFDGMTEVDANATVQRRYYDTVDASGNSVRTVTGAVVGTGGSVRHQFGAFELGAGGSTFVHGDNTQDYADISAHVRYALGSLRHAVSLSASYEPPQQTLHHYYRVSASFLAKERAPKRKFALYWYAGATAFEKGDDAVATSHRAEIYAGGTAELQCSHRLALMFGLGLAVPLVHSGAYNGSVSWLGSPLELLANFDGWDLWADLLGVGFVSVGDGSRFRFVGGISFGVTVRP